MILHGVTLNPFSLPSTFAAGYVVPLARAAVEADRTARHADFDVATRDDGARWGFEGVGTYRMIKRRAAAMRAAMAPEESAALLEEGEPALGVGLQPGSFKRAMRAWAEEKYAASGWPR